VTKGLTKVTPLKKVLERSKFTQKVKSLKKSTHDIPIRQTGGAILWKVGLSTGLPRLV
jgi:hypothetical protein